MSTHRITSTPLHGRSQSADIRAVSGETAGNLKEPKKNPTLHVLKTTSFAASFSDRPALITPQVAPVAKPTDKSVSQDIPGIIQLAKSGTWRAALRLADQLSIKMKPTAPPHILLQLSQLKIVICFKLRLFKSANEELTRLGDFNDMTYQFESYPSIYPSLQGSFVPFSLRILQAELPSYQGNSSLTIDSLYSLLTLCQEQIANSPEFQEKRPTDTSSTSWDIEDIDNLFGGPVPLPNFLNPLKTQWKEEPDLFQSDVLCWRWRYSWVQLQIISHFIQQKEYSLALPLIETLTKQFPNNASLLSAAGRFYIQIGILASAEKAFTTVESLSPPSGCEGGQFNELLEMNRGCLAVGRGDYKEASVHFSAVLNSSPNNLTAANNQAVCLVYTCKLTQAIHLLDDIIARDPSENLSEVLVQNLSCLYDLQSNSGAEKKAHLMKLVAQYGSDSFDHSLLKRHP